MKKIIRLCLICIFGISSISCSRNIQNHTHLDEPTNVITEIPLPTLETKTEAKEPQSIVIIDEKHYKEEKLNLLKGSSDYYKFYVFGKENETIYTEIYGPCTIQPVMEDNNGTVNIHVGVGTGTYCDKFIDYQNHLLSNWFVNVRAIGNEHVAYFGKHEDVPDGFYERKLIVSRKYEQNTEKKYTFPSITDEWDVDKMEFRNNETELYVHYINSDGNLENEITIPLSEFK